MYYAIVGYDREDSLSARKAVREKHLLRMQTLVDAGRLLLAGPLPAIDSEDPGPAGFTGSIIIAEFPCLEDARRWAEDDPYSRDGVFERVDVKPFKPVLP